METYCRLCHSENVPLKESYVISKIFNDIRMRR